jgi:hypothetical protein
MAPVSRFSPTLPLPPPKSDTDKDAVEAFLKPLTSEDITLLASRHKLDVSLLTNPVSSTQTALVKGNHPSNLAPLTHAIIAKNYGHLPAFSSDVTVEVDKLFPELADKTPTEIVEALRVKFEKKPSPTSGLLLQRVINQYTAQGKCEGNLSKEIEKAKAAFHKPSHSGATDDIWYTAYVDANYGGATFFEDLPSGYINGGYYYVGDSFNDKLSSIKIGCSSNEVGGYVMLFQNAYFYGNFQNYTVSTPGDPETDISYVGNGFNDQASSIIIQRRFPNETRPIPLSDLVPLNTITAEVNSISPNLRTSGNPILTWDLYPTGANNDPNEPSKAYIYLEIPCQVNTNQWFFGGWYDCQIRYWIYLYVDGNGDLQGYVDYWGYWVQGGLYTNGVASALAQEIPQHLGPVNALVSQATRLANVAGPFNFIYYLPGNGGASGNTNDGVTIVAVKRGD